MGALAKRGQPAFPGPVTFGVPLGEFEGTHPLADGTWPCVSYLWPLCVSGGTGAGVLTCGTPLILTPALDRVGWVPPADA